MDKELMAAAFTEWAKRYSENPDDFDSILDAEGKPVVDYGKRCAIYFTELYNEMENK